MNRIFRTAATLVGTAALVAGAAASSSAVTWRSSSSPLTAYEGGTAVAQAYGNFFNEGLSYAANRATYRARGSNEVYVWTDFYFYRQYLGKWGWLYDAGKRTDLRTSTAWGTQTIREPLLSGGTQARGQTRVLAARPWHTANPASVYVYPTFSY